MIKLRQIGIWGWILFLITTRCLEASLEFSEKEKEITAKYGVGELEMFFHFQNTGDQAVEILKLESTCGCTATQLEKTNYLPGEEGKIKISYKTKGLPLDSQNVTVHMKGKEETKEVLSLKIRTQEILRFNKKYVSWKRGDEPHGKKISCMVEHKDDPVSIVSVVSSDPIIKAELKNNEGRYILSLTPQNTNRKGFSKITLKTNYPKEKPATYMVYARIL